jgi:septal ring factor EnvC (AmiA/AmiB activator)
MWERIKSILAGLSKKLVVFVLLLSFTSYGCFAEPLSPQASPSTLSREEVINLLMICEQQLLLNQKQLATCKTKVDNSLQQETALNNQISSLSKQTANYSELLANYQKQVADFTIQLTALKLTYQQLVQENKRLSDQLTDLSLKLKALELGNKYKNYAIIALTITTLVAGGIAYFKK